MRPPTSRGLAAAERAPTTTASSRAPRSSTALLATHLNGERLDVDHGYPLRLIAPNRPGVLNTKWLHPGGGDLMRPYRIALAVAGGLLLALGAFRLVTELASGDLVALALWLVVAVVLHDLVIAPLTVGRGPDPDTGASAGTPLRPGRARRRAR